MNSQLTVSDDHVILARDLDTILGDITTRGGSDDLLVMSPAFSDVAWDILPICLIQCSAVLTKILHPSRRRREECCPIVFQLLDLVLA